MSEPVEYQYRTRPDWIAEWNGWNTCSKESAEAYEKNPYLHDWHYEVRALYTSPPAQRTWVGLSDEVCNAFLQGIRYAANKYEAVSDERFTGGDVSNFLLMEAEELDSSDIVKALEAAHGIKENT